MIDDPLEEEAALYAAGVMTAAEREKFSPLVDSHDELRALVAGLEIAAASVFLASIPAEGRTPPAGLKARILDQLDRHPQQAKKHASGFVITGLDGLVQWVNPAFTEMCGYSLDELRGRKLGPLLQGAGTDPSTVDRMRKAVHAHQPCAERILNYHKNGKPYWVEIAITPVEDSGGEVRWMVAEERELTDLIAA